MEMSAKLTSGPTDFRFARYSGLEWRLRLQVLPSGPERRDAPSSHGQTGSPQELLQNVSLY